MVGAKHPMIGYGVTGEETAPDHTALCRYRARRTRACGAGAPRPK
jgi:hypothetical protein